MVTTFNKREILEANIFWIEENRLPPKFICKGPDGYDFKNLFDYMKAQGYNDIDGVMQKRANQGEMIQVYWHRGERSIIASNMLYDNQTKDYHKITVEELEIMLAFERMPLMTEHDLNIWLKHEKNVEFLS